MHRLLTNLGHEMDTVQARLTATLTKLDKAMGLSKGLSAESRLCPTVTVRQMGSRLAAYAC